MESVKFFFTTEKRLKEAFENSVEKTSKEQEENSVEEQEVN